MAADEASAQALRQGLQIPHQLAFDTAHIRYQRAGLNRGRHAGNEFAHLGDGSAEDNQVSAFDSFEQIQFGLVDGPGALAFGHTGRPANEADHAIGELFVPLVARRRLIWSSIDGALSARAVDEAIATFRANLGPGPAVVLVDGFQWEEPGASATVAVTSER
jgi:hypothetical protein